MHTPTHTHRHAHPHPPANPPARTHAHAPQKHRRSPLPLARWRWTEREREREGESERGHCNAVHAQETAQRPPRNQFDTATHTNTSNNTHKEHTYTRLHCRHSMITTLGALFVANRTPKRANPRGTGTAPAQSPRCGFAALTPKQTAFEYMAAKTQHAHSTHTHTRVLNKEYLHRTCALHFHARKWTVLTQRLRSNYLTIEYYRRDASGYSKALAGTLDYNYSSYIPLVQHVALAQRLIHTPNIDGTQHLYSIC